MTSAAGSWPQLEEVGALADLSLVFDVLARDQASSTFRQVGDEAARTGQRAETGLSAIAGAARATGAVLAGAGIVTLLKDAVGAASDLSETTNKSNVIFGDSAAEIRAWAQDSARSFGLSRGAALDAASGLGNMLTQLGFTGDAAVATSTSTVQLAADLGSFNNLDTGDVLDRINGALRGEYDSLQLLIPNINAARVEQEAMAATGKANATQLTAQEKAAAVLAIVQRDGAAANNDFAETAGGLANQSKIAQAQFADFQAELGERFLPAATGALTFLNDYGIPVLGGVADTVGVVAGGVGDLVDVVTAVPGPVLAGVGAMGAVALLKGPVGDALDTIALKALYARDGLSAAGGGAGLLRTGASGLVGVLGGPVGIAIGATTIGLGFLTDALGDSRDVAEDASAAQTTFADAVRETNGAIDESVRAAAAKAAQDAGLLDIAQSLGLSLPTVTDAVLGNRDAYNELVTAANAYYDRSLSFENAGDLGMTENADRVDDFIEGLDILAPTVERTRQEQEALGEATAQTGDALAGAVPTANDFTAAMEANQQATSDAKKEVDGYKLALDILTGANVSLIDVQAAFYDSLAINYEQLGRLNGEVVNTAGGLDLTSEAGRYASDVLLGVRDSGNQLIATMQQQGATTEQVTAQDAQLRESFIATADEMGFTREQAGALADQILGIPAERQTRITADTGQAAGQIAALQEQINQVARDRTASINFRASLPDLNGAASGSGRPGLADGGMVPGWSPNPRADNIPIDATAGEFMQPVRSVDYYGVDFMEEVRTGRFPLELARRGYADGGLISLIGTADTAAASASIGKVNDDFLAAANTAARDVMEPAMGMARGLAYARSQVGKPYLWGSAGPAGFDCSGFMAAITNVVRGNSPNSRLGSTATFPWAGFASGSGLFTIGSTPDAGGGIGHMAGTILGVNVESRGGQGVVVGGSARGASNGLFAKRAHLATYDAGGLLQPGYTLAFNGTGKTETIRTAEQEADLSRPATFVGELVLDSGEFLGYIRGELREQHTADRRTATAAAAAAGTLR